MTFPRVRAALPSGGVAFAWLVLTAGLLLALAAGCGDDVTTTVGSSSSSGTGGACYSGPPRPLFTLTLTSVDGALPADTSLKVKWSAGEEPTFSLSDETTWLTLDSGANVVCDVDMKAAPMSIDMLKCQLWTSGATQVEVAGGKYAPKQQTLMPEFVADCEEPVTREVEWVMGERRDAGG